MKQILKKYLVIAIKLVVTIGFIAYLVKTRNIVLSRCFSYIKQANLLYLIVAYLLLLGGLVICNLRWALILEFLNVRLPRWRLLQYYVIGMFFSLFFPSVVGGDLVKIYYVRRDSGRPLPLALTSIYLDRACGLLIMLILGLIGALSSPMVFTPRDFRPLGWFGLKQLPVWSVALVLLTAFLIANWVLFSHRLYRILIWALGRFGLMKLAEKVRMIHEAMGSFRQKPSVLGKPLLLSTANISLAIFVNWLVALALGINVSLLAMAATVTLMSVLVMLPISINGIGLRENAYVGMLALVGVPGERSFALSIVSFVLVILSALPGGVFYSLLKRKIPINEPMAVAQRFEGNTGKTDFQ